MRTIERASVMKKFCMLLTVILAFSTGGCSKKRGDQRPSISQIAGSLKEIINAAPKSIVDLDALPAEPIYPELIMGGETVAVGKGKLFLAYPTTCVAEGDSLYISDKANNAIIVADEKGNLIRKIGRLGRGPGEFSDPWQIGAIGDKGFAVCDARNGRLQIFDRQFRYVASLPTEFAPVFTAAAAGDGQRLFVHGNFHDSVLIHVYKAEKPFEHLFSLLPASHLPHDYKNARFAVNKHGWLCAGYTALPYLFVFDSLLHQRSTIELKGKPVDELNEPPPRRLRTPSGRAPVRMFIFGLSLLEDGTIILAAGGGDLYFLCEEGGKYYLLKHFHIAFDDKLYVSAIDCSRDRLYVTLAYKPIVLKLRLPKEVVAMAKGLQ